MLLFARALFQRKTPLSMSTRSMRFVVHVQKIDTLLCKVWTSSQCIPTICPSNVAMAGNAVQKIQRQVNEEMDANNIYMKWHLRANSQRQPW